MTEIKIAGYLQGYLPKTARDELAAVRERFAPGDEREAALRELGIEQMREEATALKVLAVKGDSEAQNELGDTYQGGRGPEIDRIEAAKWWRKAAEQGHADAQYSLGGMRGVSNAESAKWYRKAAEQGHKAAQQSLGYMYEKGEGVPQDKAEARKWFRKANAARFSPDGVPRHWWDPEGEFDSLEWDPARKEWREKKKQVTGKTGE